MKKIMMFYQPMCPFCKKAFKYIEELSRENPQYSEIKIDKIDELANPEFADKYDYYYVPTFYVDGKKVHEGGIFKEEMRNLLQSVIDGSDFVIKDV